MTEQELLAMAQYGPMGNPMLFDGPPNLYQQQPQQSMQQQPSGFDQIMSSPYTAMAMQGLNNIAALRRDRPVQQSPTQAYQSQVAFNTRLRLQEEQEKRAKKLMEARDPYYAFEEGKRRGHLPEEMTWAEFEQSRFRRGQMDTAKIREFQQWTRLNPQRPGETDEDYEKRVREAYDNILTRPSLTGGPGGTQLLYNPMTGDVQYAVTGQEAQLLEQGYQYAKGTGEGKAGTERKQINQAIESIDANKAAYTLANHILDGSQRYLDMLNAGQVDTGLVNAFFLRTFGRGTKELAAMDAQAVDEMLKGLQIVNLAPVTIAELQLMARRWADIGRSEEPNKGVLEEVIRKTELLMDDIMNRTAMEADRLRSYDANEYDRVRQFNPFMQQSIDVNKEVEIPGL